MDVGGVIGLLIGLAVVVALAFYFVSNYEDPPLWWPNFARPDWDKDPEDFTDIETTQEEGEANTFTGVVKGGGKYAS